MQSQKRKVNNAGAGLGPVGRVSCLGLLALGLALVGPTCGNVSALTSEELENGSLTSSVSISFAPASGNATLSPTGAAGASGLISVLANVGVTNSGGYSVYLGSNSPNLVGKKNAANVIPGVSGEVSFVNLQDNTWGYYAGEGSSIPESATYKSVSQGQGEVIFANNNSRVKDENKTFVLGFAAKITNSVPADTYENQVTLSVVSNPYQLTLMDISNMQEMTNQICENTPGLATKQLKDVRDGKYYWVTKLADNKCWMTQNLDLDLSTNVALTPKDSDVKTNWTPEYNTANMADESTILADDTGTRSWSLGNYRLTNPDISNDCGFSKNSAAGCPEQFTTYTMPTTADGDELAHYILGNHYQWNAATAGTGGTIVNSIATSSICPNGWRLPTGSTGGELEDLVMTLGGISPASNITKAPFYGTRSGRVEQNVDSLFAFAGSYGNYWSSVSAITNDSGAYILAFTNTTTFVANTRQVGRSVRCIAR